MEQAIQWWYERQSRQLTSEAVQIRDRLLQESFAVRRGLELAQIQSKQLFNHSEPKWIERFELFHTYLKELSDRLSPPYLEEGLPWAIEYLIEQWKIARPSWEFQWQFTPRWRQDRSQRNRIILTTIDELLKLEIAKYIKKGFIFIDLQQNQGDNQLKIRVESSKFNGISCSSIHRELEYLRQSFQVFTSGTWTILSNDESTIHYLKWSTKSE